MASNHVTLRPSTVARVLSVVTVVLILASIAGQVALHAVGTDPTGGLVKLFHLDAEQNVPATFSTFLLILAAILLAVVAGIERGRTNARLSYWLLLSLAFVWMALDENASLHERLIGPIRGLFGGADLGIFYFAWVIPAIAVVVFAAPFFIRFLRGLPAVTRRDFTLAAALYLGGALGLELVGGRHAEAFGVHSLWYDAITTAEEGLEMAGLIVLICGLLRYAAATYGEVRFKLDAPANVVQLSEATDQGLGTTNLRTGREMS